MKIIVLALTFYFAIGQNIRSQSLDSLEIKLNSRQISVSEKIETLNLLSRDLSFISSAKALAMAKEALELSSKTNNLSGQAYAYRNLSSVYYDSESYLQGMEYLNRALDIFRKINDKEGIANCYISLGHLYRQLKDRKQEIDYHKKSFEIFSDLKIKERIGVTSHNLGESYYYNNEFNKSRKLTVYAIGINKSINNLSVLSSCYKVIGLVEFAEKNYDEAEKHFLNVIEISSQLGENSQKIATIESLLQLAEIYQLNGNTAAHLEYLKKAAAFSHDNSLPNHLKNTYTQLVLYFSKNNNQLEVQNYVLEYNTVLDSIDTRQIKNRSDLIKSVIQVHELENQKASLEERNLQKVAELRSRNLIIILVVFFALFLIWIFFQQKRTNGKLETANQLLHRQQLIIESQRLHLEELNKTKDKFFSIVAHDLKSPLNNLKSFSGILVDDIDSISKEEISFLSKQLQTSVDNTIKLADNLITWARVQMKDFKTNIEKLNLAEVVLSSRDVYDEVARNKGIQIRTDFAENLSFLGDRYQITFVLRNLINNAIKFSHPGGFVTIEACYVPGNELQISVSDTGMGIAEDVKKSIFSIDKKQSIVGTAGEKGTGLGLMLSYEFVQLNNGSIDVQSESGEGTTFRIRLKTS